MPKATKYTVTHPDNTVSTRSSARTYTHVIVAVPATREARRVAMNRHADELIARAEVLEAAADAGVVKGKSRGLNISQAEFHAFDYFLVGTETRGSKGNRYYGVTERGNSEGLHETWREYIGDLEVVRETGEDHGGKMRVAVKVKGFVILKARQQAASYRDAAAQLRIDAELPDPNGYEALRWSSRADLAYKALSEFDYQAQTGRTLQVVAVD